MAADQAQESQAQALGRGRALLVRGRTEAAKEAAQSVLQQTPDHADALCLLGQCFAAADDRLQVGGLLLQTSHMLAVP